MPVKAMIIMLSAMPLLVRPVIAEDYEYDEANGDEINQVCAACHGEYGMGGKGGKYPRLAGLPVDYLAAQLTLFRTRQRPNLAMVEHVDERQFTDTDIMDISIYLNRIRPRTSLPPVNENAPGFNALKRLVEAKQVLQIPREEGDVEAGEKLYRKECGACHGKKGEGSDKYAVPPLASQYINYLREQVKFYIEKKRIHDADDPDGEYLSEFTEREIDDIFAYMSVLDD